jgi:hypothetical protein
MRILLRLCFMTCMGIQLAAQQTATLRHRGKGPDANDTVPVTEKKAPSTLPVDASGEYLLGSDPLDVVQITLQPKELSGYISRRGASESDGGTPLTFFFNHTRLDGPRLGFTTIQVHGAWYSFEGTITRGPGKSRAEEGYYLLQGTLILNDMSGGKSERHTVSLKLSRQS